MTTSGRRGAGAASTGTAGNEADRQLTKADYEALAEFRYYLRRFLDFSQRAARDFGLTPQQHQALLSITGKPGDGLMTISELADHLLIKHHSAVELADRLEALGLVQRRTDETDRRRVLLSLTGSARELLAGMSSVHLEELRRIGPQLATLLAGLERDRAATK